MESVYKFLKEVGTYYLATVEGEQPRVRPFGSVNIFDGKLYIHFIPIQKLNRDVLVWEKASIFLLSIKAITGHTFLRLYKIKAWRYTLVTRKQIILLGIKNQ